jgi:sugar lactone lactonase YvrE
MARIAALALALLAVCAASAHAAFAGRDGLIAFAANPYQEGCNDTFDPCPPSGVYLVRSDGTGLHKVRGTSEPETLSWSADGRRLYVGDRVWRVSGTTAHRVRGARPPRGVRPPQGVHADLGISPNGRFVAVTTAGGQLAVRDRRTDRRRTLGPGPSMLPTLVDFSPDSRRIVYAAADGVCIVRVDGGGRRCPLDSSWNDAAFSPSGRWLVGGRFSDGAGSLWIVRPDGTGAREIVSGHTLDMNGWWLAAWQPVGRG